ncbi:unnamed protein product [Diatraea saccharalis]|uniref:Uncharacterized protein n=1 Tax=Diatraea saccharalis TaxID=40085 RepID=A0A9N9R7T6_9NEOP|nr:unnamed protein product [Diatraea saccharalis]
MVGLYYVREPSAISQLIKTYEYEDITDDVLDSIPEHDLRLLTTLARKREIDDERERLADQFRRMWQKEKQERQMVEAETLAQYRRYLHNKRQEERTWQEYRHMQKSLEQHIRKAEILDCIRHKEKRSAVLLAHMDDKKATEIVDKALEEQARAQLAADRRTRLCVAEECRRILDLADTERRANDASKRRNAFLRDASQRVAISNALNSWETTLLRQEVTALDAARRAACAARAALVDSRATRLARARENRLRRARKLASITAQLRDAIRSGKM